MHGYLSGEIQIDRGRVYTLGRAEGVFGVCEKPGQSGISRNFLEFI